MLCYFKSIDSQRYLITTISFLMILNCNDAYKLLRVPAGQAKKQIQPQPNDYEYIITYAVALSFIVSVGKK